MAEKTLEYYRGKFKHASEQMTTFLGSIAMSELDSAKHAKRIDILKRTIDEQRTNMAQDNKKYQKLFNRPEHIAYKEFAAKSQDALTELDNLPKIQQMEGLFD